MEGINEEDTTELQSSDKVERGESLGNGGEESRNGEERKQRIKRIEGSRRKRMKFIRG